MLVWMDFADVTEASKQLPWIIFSGIGDKNQGLWHGKRGL
jgi:hypothetical protein